MQSDLSIEAHVDRCREAVAARGGAVRSVWRGGRQWVRDGRHVHRDAIAARYRVALQRILG